jgi:hypothetical protein
MHIMQNKVPRNALEELYVLMYPSEKKIQVVQVVLLGLLVFCLLNMIWTNCPYSLNSTEIFYDLLCQMSLPNHRTVLQYAFLDNMFE